MDSHSGTALRAAATLALGIASGPLTAQQAASPAGGTFGQVRFAVSCSDEARAHVDRGMAQYHSYFWPEARRSFERAAAADAQCGMAHWGLAIVTMDNPFQWPLTGKALAEGAAHLERARAAGLRTKRERDYVDAADAFYRDPERVPAHTRQLEYEMRLEKIAREHPDDLEATVLHAMVLSANFAPNDKTYRNQHRAADILEPLMARHPSHPGVPHYLIHTYDYPPLASRGLKAAYRYRDVAPSAPHALHMPSHIFTRLGLWEDSIASNRTAMDSTRDLRTRLHSMDYMAYAFLQLGDEAAAARVADEVRAISKVPEENFTAAYALAAVPARMAIERERWADAAALALSPGEFDFAWPRFPHAEALNAFTRGLGAARAGRPDAARLETARLATLRDTMFEAKLHYWVGQTDIQIATLRAWTAFAEGRGAEAIDAMRRAADAEDATEKNVVTPGPLKPARELLGEMLLAEGRRDDARAAFEQVLKTEPNRRAARIGLARSQAADATPTGTGPPTSLQDIARR